MTKNLLFAMIASFLFSLNGIAVNLIKNGDMETKGAWKEAVINPPATATFGHTEAGFGTGKVLKLSGPGQSHIYVYQEVLLVQGNVYDLSFNYKAQATSTWCEIHISTTQPVEGMDTHTGLPVIKLIDDVANTTGEVDKQFIAQENGLHYFVIKIGSWGTGNTFNLFVDNVVLDGVSAGNVMANFDVSPGTVGIKAQEMSFTDKSAGATSWSWNFGDGSTSTDKSPKHTYNTAGIYSVALSVTDGTDNNSITKKIRVLDPDKGEQIMAGNMELADAWEHAPVGGTALTGYEFNYTAGSAKGLRLYATPPSGNGTNIFLYQPIYLKAGEKYELNGKFIQLNANANQYWCQFYVLPFIPTSDDDTKEENSIMTMGAWNQGEFQGEAKTYDLVADGRCGPNAAFAAFTAASSGIYYFIIKAGTWSGTFNFVLDDISFKYANGTNIPALQSNVKIYSENKQIIAQGEMNIYNANGQLVDKATNTSKTLQAGLYIVTINGIAQKVIVK